MAPIKKNYTVVTRCFDCRKLEIKCEPSIENPKICKRCYKKGITLCIKIKPKKLEDEIIRLTSVINDHETRIQKLESRVLKLEKNEILVKQNISQLYTIFECDSF
jgi:uncharacterized protein (DUF342 family)